MWVLSVSSPTQRPGRCIDCVYGTEKLVWASNADSARPVDALCSDHCALAVGITPRENNYITFTPAAATRHCVTTLKLGRDVCNSDRKE